MMFKIRSIRFWGLALLWFGVVMAGFAYLTEYSLRPGDPGRTGVDWPRESRLSPPKDAMKLIMSAHPRCPCTRASIAGLARIMARQPGSAIAHVLFWTPDGPEEWAHTGLWKAAAAIPGVSVHADVDGVEAKRFGLETSGHALFYSKTGELLFTGGITASRGHQGPSIGKAAILDLASGKPAPASVSAVFGCPLFNPPETASIR